MQDLTDLALGDIFRQLRNLLHYTPIFFPLRSVYQRLFKRRNLAFRRWMLDVYAPFVSKGDLVFDVGANIGLYSEVFSELGAHVVAVEPNPDCCLSLDRLARIRQVTVENCAVSDHVGRIPFHVCTTNSQLSTVSGDWLQITQQSPPPACWNSHWSEVIEVKCVTLDQLAARYGIPTFVKIDVEGHDDAVLRGMSFRPEVLSFEFTLRMPQVALRCLEALANGGEDYKFNFIRPTEPLGRWMEARELRRKFLAPESEYSDVLATWRTYNK